MAFLFLRTAAPTLGNARRISFKGSARSSLTLPAWCWIFSALRPRISGALRLDLSPCPTELLLTKDGCQEKPGTIPKAPGFEEKTLLCHYRVSDFTESVIRFTLWRTREDLLALASRWDNVHYIALRQEWEV